MEICFGHHNCIGRTTFGRDCGYLDNQVIKEWEKIAYTKFERTFHSINICSLPKSYKIHLCRVSRNAIAIRPTPSLQLDVYDKLRCRRYRIQSRLGDTEFFFSIGEDPREEMHFHLLLCPRERRQLKGKMIANFDYLTSNLHSSSMTLLTRHNTWDTKFKRETIFWNVDTDVMVKDRRRVRKMKYPSEIVRKEELMKLQRNDLKEFENEFYWMMTSVQPPITMARAGLIRWEEAPAILTPITITRREPLVEDILISYSKIKAMKLAYKRFMETYWSLDICSLPRRLKKALCHNVLNQSPFQYYPSSDGDEQSNASSNSIDMELEETYQVHPPDKNINSRCSKREVNLEIREIESLKAKYFSMWQCPKAEITSGYTTTYYIAKYHLKNALLVFKTCDAWNNDDIIFPEAVATEIDREGLARIVLNDATAH